MKKAVFVMLGIAGVVFLGLGTDSEHNVVAAEEKENNVTVFYEGIPYIGTVVEGTVEGGALNGEGVVEIKDDEDNAIRLSGNWENSELSGKAEIILSDESVIYTKYKEGHANGNAVRKYVDGSSQTYSYSDGLPRGRVVSYNSMGNIINIDRYFEGRLISEWCELATAFDHDQAYRDQEDYYGEPVFFSGTVTDLFGSDSDTYVAVENKQSQTLIFRYANGATAQNQALVPNLSIGQNVTFYGLFEKYEQMYSGGWAKIVNVTDMEEEFSVCEFGGENWKERIPLLVNNESLFSLLPVVRAVYAKIEGEDFALSEKELEEPEEITYETIVKYPYSVDMFSRSGRAEIINILVYQSESKMRMLLREKGTGNYYYGIYAPKAEESIPWVGQEISFTGDLKGCAKLQQYCETQEGLALEYIVFPRINITSIE